MNCYAVKKWNNYAIITMGKCNVKRESFIIMPWHTAGLGAISVKDTRVLGLPERAQKDSPVKTEVFQGAIKIWREANLP